jgi:hypothetical protein
MQLSKDTFTTYKKLITQKSYFDAHEVFESIWFPIRKQKGHKTIILRGFINCAVSFELFKRGRLPQSEKVYKNYLNMVKDLDNLDIEYKKEFLDLKYFLDDYYSKNINTACLLK